MPVMTPEERDRMIRENEEHCKNHLTSYQTGYLTNTNDTHMENDWLAWFVEQALTYEEYCSLVMKLDADPELADLFRKVILYASSFKGSRGGLVRGQPEQWINGIPVQDDRVPALLQHHNYVIRALAVRQIGADKLQRMMEEAQAEYDARVEETL